MAKNIGDQGLCLLTDVPKDRNSLLKVNLAYLKITNVYISF